MLKCLATDCSKSRSATGRLRFSPWRTERSTHDSFCREAGQIEAFANTNPPRCLFAVYGHVDVHGSGSHHEHPVPSILETFKFV